MTINLCDYGIENASFAILRAIYTRLEENNLFSLEKMQIDIHSNDRVESQK